MSAPKTLLIEVSMSEIENRSRGNWFSANSMKFFKSRVGDIGYQGKDGYYFVSSERCLSGPRLYTIRHLNSEGHVEKIGEFQEYSTKARATAALKHMLIEQGAVS